MNTTCNDAQDRLPELVTSRLASGERATLEAHVAGCPECREVLETLQLLAAAPPRVPEGIEARIRERLRARTPRAEVPRASSPRWRTPAWALAAAAVVALLLGRSLLSSRTEGPAFIALGESDLPVLLDEALVAGAPVLDGLTDEEINLLLEEFEG